MADEPDDKKTESTFKKWVNDVLDERETKAKADAEEKAKKDKEEADKHRTREPASLLRQFLGA
jgi:hypothetical protein